MNLPEVNPRLFNLSKINVLMGKNGCGKSTILRDIDRFRQGNTGLTRYITPERGGILKYDGNIETNIGNNSNWLSEIKRRNRQENFRETSVFEFRRLETLVLRTIEQDKNVRRSSFTFTETIKQINRLLDNIEIRRANDIGFSVRGIQESQIRQELDSLSSGESELVSLAIDILSFCYQVKTNGSLGKQNILLLDEPDVHLHPDLQYRLMKLIVSAISDCELTVIIATHSTAILGAFSDEPYASVGFMQKKGDEVRFRSVSKAMKTILPVFGAHPLSEVFNKSPILLVEGEDDERIWQCAVRSSQGKLKIWPCVAGDKQSLNTYEDEVQAIAGAIYERPVAYSLRDRDDSPYKIDDKIIVIRMRLQCRTAENMIVSNEVLRLLGTDWVSLRNAIEAWLENNQAHKQFETMKAFKDNGWNRMNADLKPFRNILMERAGSDKPWEVAVGQAIARAYVDGGSNEEHGILNYLGPKLVEKMGFMKT